MSLCFRCLLFGAKAGNWRGTKSSIISAGFSPLCCPHTHMKIIKTEFSSSSFQTINFLPFIWKPMQKNETISRNNHFSFFIVFLFSLCPSLSQTQVSFIYSLCSYFPSLVIILSVCLSQNCVYINTIFYNIVRHWLFFLLFCVFYIVEMFHLLSSTVNLLLIFKPF